ncbi:MAG: hypothetical protein JNK23_00285 [Opitutaceae bacterium]|nr:hypothetical protein [Opitutaceae bacterium]
MPNHPHHSRPLDLENSFERAITFTTPVDATAKELHLILEESDRNPLAHHRRVVIAAQP